MNECRLSIYEFWEANAENIAVFRRWKHPQKTISTYGSRIALLANNSPEVIKERAISDLSVYNIVSALRKVTTYVGAGERREYSDGAFRLFLSILRDIYRYADAVDAAINIFDKASNALIKKLFFSSSPEVKAKRSSYQGYTRSKRRGNQADEALERLLFERDTKRKSLTHSEMRAIVDLIEKNYERDGRYIGIAISLYTGLRPGECRALRWEDIAFIPGTNNRFFKVHQALDFQNNIVDPKTNNGYRNVPIHSELDTLLIRWYDHLRKTVKKHSLIKSHYIVCKGNEFEKPCNYRDFADFAKKKVLNLLDSEPIETNSIDMTLLKPSDIKYDKEDNLTLYILRRNFWTWLQYGTQCSTQEKLYVMGHDMKINKQNTRSKLSNPQALSLISDHMNQFSIQPKLHLYERLVFPDIFIEQKNRFANVGCIDIHFNMRRIQENPFEVSFDVHCIERGDKVELQLLTEIQNHFRVHVDLSYNESPMPTSLHYDLNTQALSRTAAGDNPHKRNKLTAEK